MKLDHAAFDRRLMDSLREGRVEEAATRALKTYGTEIYALLASLHRADRDADDVFSSFCEQLWRALPRFEGRSTFRTWAYAIAWRVSSRHRLSEQSRREVLATDADYAALAKQIRTSTASQLRKARSSRLRRWRETLPAEDQLLLVLRIDRELDWKDLSRVMNPDVELSEDELVRESARLRKRFQTVKERLRELIREHSGSSSD
jgi:RNA polymerase sigma-70 factor (ECF subfamily)